MAHGHDVLHMMEGKEYANNLELVAAIIKQFGEQERFHTCSQEGLTAQELVELLEKRGKFKPVHNKGFTVDSSKICS